MPLHMQEHVVLFDAEKGMEVLEQHLMNRRRTLEVHALRVEGIPLGHKAVPSRAQARGPYVTAILVVDACEQRHPLLHVASGFVVMLIVEAHDAVVVSMMCD